MKKYNYPFDSYYFFVVKRLYNLLIRKALLVILLHLSTYIYSQEVQITGLENIHVSEGAIIIVQSKKDTLELKNNENNLLTSHNKTSKNVQSKKDKKSIFFAKKTKKLIEGKTIKKIENSKEIIVYNAKNNDSENFFTNIKNFCKSIVISQNAYQFINPNNSLDILYLSKIHQTKENVLYKAHYSTSVENILFSRPPPVFNLFNLF